MALSRTGARGVRSGLFIEPDGRAYLATASTADGTITLLTLDKELAHVTAIAEIHYIKGAEGSKIIRRGAYYYLFNALPPRLALTVSRSRSLFGPWETRDQIDDKTGGHQGALVDLPDGRWFGFVMEDSGAIGRMTNLSPVFWQDDWPVWGTPTGTRPRAAPCGQADPGCGLRGAGDVGRFRRSPRSAAVAMEPQSRACALVPDRAARLGCGCGRRSAPGFWSARNTLIQKGQGPASRAEVKLDIAASGPAHRCGFGTLGQFSANITVQGAAAGKATLAMEVSEDREGGRGRRGSERSSAGRRASRSSQGELAVAAAPISTSRSDEGRLSYRPP